MLDFFKKYFTLYILLTLYKITFNLQLKIHFPLSTFNIQLNSLSTFNFLPNHFIIARIMDDSYFSC